jgi:ribosomal protein S6--L-glutamate ligase
MDINNGNAKIVYSLLPKPFIIQEKIDKVRDVRALVIGDDVIGAIYRLPAPGRLITNVHAGGEVDPAPKEAYAKTAVFATKKLGLYYAGVDMIEGFPEKVIEVNASPLWKGISKALSLDVPKLLVDFFISLAKK